MALGAATAYGERYREAFITKPRSYVNPSVAHGSVRCIIATLDIGATLAAVPAETLGIAGVVYLGGEKLPVGANIIDARLHTDGDATAGTVTLRLDEQALMQISAALGTEATTTPNAATMSTYPISTAAGADGILNFLIGAACTGVGIVTAYVWYMQD